MSVTKYQKFEPVTMHRSEFKGVPWNPRQISKANARNLRDGIKRFGLVGGIVVNKRTGNVVSGHQRIGQLDALEESEDYSVTVDVIDVSEQEERQLNVLLNNPQASGQFDVSLLSEVIGSIQEQGGDVHATGFSTKDLHLLFGDEFLAGPFAAQRDQEKADIDLLAGIRESSRATFGNSEPESEPKADESLPEDEKPLVPAHTVHTKESLAARRKEYIASRTNNQDQADVLVTFCFDRSEQIAPILKALGVDGRERYIDARVLAEALGVEL